MQGLKSKTLKQNLTSTGSEYRRRYHKIGYTILRSCEMSRSKLSNQETSLKEARTFHITKKEWERKRKANKPRTFCHTKKECQRRKESNRLKNSSQHQKVVATNIKGSRAIKFSITNREWEQRLQTRCKSLFARCR
jgi:hypothetical protein